MKYVINSVIFDVLSKTEKPKNSTVEAVLKKTMTLQRLTLEEMAVLLNTADPVMLEKIYTSAFRVKEQIYGKRVVMFAPLYISNLCANNCLYCSFKSDNTGIKRRALTPDEIKEQVLWLLKRGHKRILLVAGETAPKGRNAADYYVEAINAVYSAKSGGDKIRRVNINCAPLSVDDFRKIKKAGIGTYQIFQETYHDDTYRQVHPSGPKSDPDNRLDAVDRAFEAGIDDIGIGVLYGLYDYKFETLAMLSHIEYLERKFGVGPHTISVPRIEPAIGSELSLNPPHKLSDDEFKKAVAVLRLSVPYTGMILSTRETAKLRDELFDLGISQISAESRTSPGGYSEQDNNENLGIQFQLGDQRTLDEVVESLINKGFIPSFCAACYRKERTGKAFMNLAKPGTIKGKCSINAMVTLKEYLDDFASPEVKTKGYALIEKMSKTLSENDKKTLSHFFEDIVSGKRDKYV